jgi:hypothetical protein
MKTLNQIFGRKKHQIGSTPTEDILRRKVTQNTNKLMKTCSHERNNKFGDLCENICIGYSDEIVSYDWKMFY